METDYSYNNDDYADNYEWAASPYMNSKGSGAFGINKTEDKVFAGQELPDINQPDPSSNFSLQNGNFNLQYMKDYYNEYEMESDSLVQQSNGQNGHKHGFVNDETQIENKTRTHNHQYTHSNQRQVDRSTMNFKKNVPAQHLNCDTFSNQKSQTNPPKYQKSSDGSLSKTRKELSTLRDSLLDLKIKHVKDERSIQTLLSNENKKDNSEPKEDEKDTQEKAETVNPLFNHWKPIGYMESPYMHKNGTPRQGCLVKESKGCIRILDAIFNNPEHSLHGLEEYSHVWLLFIFDQNGSSPYTKAKVSPPRLGGKRIGVFASRAPHRPNPIGITLAKLDRVTGGTVHVSGVDLLFGTPILDIKPYIPEYDSPQQTSPFTSENFMAQVVSSTPVATPKLASESQNPLSRGIVKEKVVHSPKDIEKLIAKSSSEKRLTTAEQLENSKKMNNALDSLENSITLPEWLSKSRKSLKVLFNPLAEEQIQLFSTNPVDSRFRLKHCESAASLKTLIAEGLQTDPRSVYRKEKCSDLIHHITVDVAQVSCVFFDDDSVEVLRVKPTLPIV